MIIRGASFALAGMASLALAQGRFTDVGEDDAIAGAVNWLQRTMLGTVATAGAILAVASIGFMMLTGRTNWARGITVILGCFVLFSAQEIASTLTGVARATQSIDTSEEPLPVPAMAATPPPSLYDPYAGAAVVSPGLNDHDLSAVKR